MPRPRLVVARARCVSGLVPALVLVASWAMARHAAAGGSAPPTAPGAANVEAKGDTATVAPTDVAAMRRAAMAATDPILAVGAYARTLEALTDAPAPDAVTTFVDDAAAHARLPLVRARAGFDRAQALARAAQFDAADAAFDRLGMPRDVLVLGPFDNTGGTAFATASPGDDVVTTLRTGAEGAHGTLHWARVPRDPRGPFDVGAQFVERREVRALVAVAVHAPREQDVALRTGASGQLRVLVDGVERAREDCERPYGFDTGAASVRLTRGWNLVVVELGMTAGVGLLSLRISAPDGGPAPGIRFSTSPGDIAAAARARPIAAAHTTIAQADPARVLDSDDAALLDAAAAIDARERGFDARARPTRLQGILGRLVRVLDDTRASSAARAQARARLADDLAGRDASAAHALLREARNIDGDNVPMLLSYARFLEDHDAEQEASRLLARARTLVPGSPRVAVRAWELERRRGVRGVIVEREVLAAAARPDAGDPLLVLAADVAGDRRDAGAALSWLMRTRNEAARRADVQTAILQARLGVDRAALLQLEEVLRLRVRLLPANHNIARDLADVLLARSVDDARAFVDERIRRYPQRPEPLALRAGIALARGDRAAARASLQAALVLVPQDDELARQLRALGADEDPLVARWLAEPVDVTAPPDAAREGAHVASHTIAIRFFENGLGRIVEDVVVVVDDARRVGDSLRTFATAYSGGREKVDVLVADRTGRDGLREAALSQNDVGQEGKEGGMYSDVRRRIVQFGTLHDGDVLHVRTRKELVAQQNLFGDFFGHSEAFTDRFFVRRARLVVEAPAARPLTWGGRGAPAPRVVQEGDVRIYDFELRDLPALVGERGMPPWAELSSTVSVSTYATWQDLGAWYEALIAPQLLLDDELRAIAQGARAMSRDDAEVVRRLYEEVVTRTRYVGIELGIHGWKPYPVAEVHRRRFGDCKDKASLLVALLREAGVDANIALVRTADLGVIDAMPPSMWTFNHAIAYVPSLDLFLDGTAEHSGWHELPAMDQGAMTLVVGAHGKHAGSELRTIPVQPADANQNASDYTLDVQNDGAMHVRGTERFRGSHNAEERRLWSDTATRRVNLERRLSQSMPGARATELQVGPLDLSVEELQYTFEASLPGRASREPDGSLSLPLSLYPQGLAAAYADASTRRFDLWIDHPWRTRNVMRYRLPDGWRVVDLPVGGGVHGHGIEFTQTITPTVDGFIVDEDAAVTARRLAPSQYAAFRADALAADALMNRIIHIAPVGATTGPASGATTPRAGGHR